MLIPIFIYFFSLLSYAQEAPLVTVHRSVNVMGSKFSVTVVASNEEIGYINIAEAISEIKRVEKLLSTKDENSETAQINSNAGIKPVKVSQELFRLIERANQISEMTYGAFDITQAGLDNIWRFDGTMQYLPTETEIEEALKTIGYKNIILDPKEYTVFLKVKGMKIGFGGIGKGYAMDKAKELMVSIQVKAGVINAGGNLTTWGTKTSGEKWMLGIANPLNKEKIFSWLPVLESSVATTQSYDSFISFKGKKYSHILDPRTGIPSIGVNSVSVFTKSAELGDALSNAVFVLGRDRGMALIYQLKGTEVIIVDSDNVMHKSPGIQLD